MSDDYLERRKSFAERMGAEDLFDSIDHWPLFVGIKNLARFTYIGDIVRSVIDVPGDLAEFGSWRGTNVVYQAKLLELFAPGSSKRVHCFESFEGLETFSPEDGPQAGMEGKYRGRRDVLEDVMDLYDLGSRIEIHQGLIQDTVPAFLAAEPNTRFSFLYFDADLYEPAKVMLDQIAPLLSVGGVMLFDEWNFPQWPGETLAVSEFLESHHNFDQVQPTLTDQPSLLLRKVAP